MPRLQYDEMSSWIILEALGRENDMKYRTRVETACAGHGAGGTWTPEREKKAVEGIILMIVAQIVPLLPGIKPSTAAMCLEATMASVGATVRVAMDDCAMWAHAWDALAVLESAAAEASVHPDYAANFAAKAVVGAAHATATNAEGEEVLCIGCEIWEAAAQVAEAAS